MEGDMKVPQQSNSVVSNISYPFFMTQCYLLFITEVPSTGEILYCEGGEAVARVALIRDF